MERAFQIVFFASLINDRFNFLNCDNRVKSLQFSYFLSFHAHDRFLFFCTERGTGETKYASEIFYFPFF